MRTVYERKAFVKFFERIVYFSDLYNQEGSFFFFSDAGWIYVFGLFCEYCSRGLYQSPVAIFSLSLLSILC